MEMVEVGFEPLGSTAPQRRWTPAAWRRRPQGEGRRPESIPPSPPSYVYGGSRLHLRDDWSRTPSGPEGSSGRDLSRAPKSCWRGPPPKRRATIPYELRRPSAQMAPQTLSRNGRAGARAARAQQCPRQRQSPPCIPVYRDSRRRQNDGRAYFGEIAELRNQWREFQSLRRLCRLHGDLRGQICACARAG